MFIQESVYDRVIDKIKKRMDKLRVGAPLDKAVDMGAVVDASQLATVQEFVEDARAEGAEVGPRKGL